MVFVLQFVLHTLTNKERYLCLDGKCKLTGFGFAGSRYVSWLPSFSVEVTHTQLLRADQGPPVQTSQLDAMARQVSSCNLP